MNLLANCVVDMVVVQKLPVAAGLYTSALFAEMSIRLGGLLARRQAGIASHDNEQPPASALNMQS